ncbi:MAG: glycerol-3-phosphate dehydrogenase/oxidase, partial [Verrucomicrobia bacterium]|nr:glycerol-3-phosphate dehydrogenase/oxidase [Verrucomicrobiota bacterium]
MLSRDEVLQRVPALEPKGLRGGVAYHDGQFDDSRLLINLLQTAAEHGAAILNYSRVTGFLKDAAGRIAGLAFRNGESGREYSIGARCVINATGPFCDQVRRLDDETAAPLIAPSQGAHIVLPKEFLPGDSAILVPHTADGRVMFAIPWHGHVVAGTTDTPVSEVALEPRATENEVNLILQTTGRYLARMPALADILSVFAGIRPLIKGKSTATSALRRDHAIRVSPSGLVTVAGGKWTTYRKMAEDAVDCALELACLPHRGCRTHQLPVHGFQRPQQSGPFANYGSDAEPIAALIREQPGLARPLHESLPVCGAQIVWAVRHEMAATLEDVLARRTRALFLNARAALAIAPAVARLMAIALDRDEKWEHLQLAAFQEVAAGFLPPATRAENL